jgi:hypothetical protein
VPYSETQNHQYVSPSFAQATALTTQFSPSHLVHNYIINPIRKRHQAWKYLLDGPGIIQAGYDQVSPIPHHANPPEKGVSKQTTDTVQKSNGKPFEILSPDTRHIFITNPDQLAEMDAASTPGNVLSLYAASQRALQPMYTMHRFGWYDVPPEGLGYVRALRTLLTNYLPNLLPELRGMMGDRFEELRSGDGVVNGIFFSSPPFFLVVGCVLIVL